MIAQETLAARARRLLGDALGAVDAGEYETASEVAAVALLTLNDLVDGDPTAGAAVAGRPAKAPEQHRILAAIRDGKLFVRPSGRYAIEGAEPPNRRERERLLQRQWVAWASGRAGLKLTDEGRKALAALEARDA